ncbi:CAP domain-containing protein [Streptomyces sp. NPDC059785]|uniref:CAP domain-containing protein n=1 Tax=Streptomyces sp. NPDC059785 TaxID=3346945 RepID=UPI003662E8EA
MNELVPGGNTPLPSGTLTFRVPGPFDVSALVTDDGGKVRGDGDFVFYNQPAAPGVRLRGDGLSVDPSALRPGAGRVTLVVSPADPGTPLGRLPAPVLTVTGPGGRALARFAPPRPQRETVLLLAEVYRRGTGWKLRALGQGYADGLAGVARDFGIEVTEEPTSGGGASGRTGGGAAAGPMAGGVTSGLYGGGAASGPTAGGAASGPTAGGAASGRHAGGAASGPSAGGPASGRYAGGAASGPTAGGPASGRYAGGAASGPTAGGAASGRHAGGAASGPFGGGPVSVPSAGAPPSPGSARAASGGGDPDGFAAEVNSARAAAGAPPVLLDARLTAAAGAHAAAMAAAGRLAAEGPDGVSVHQRVTASGYAYLTVGEHLVSGPRTPAEFVRYCLTEERPRRTLCDPVFRHAGLGHAPDPRSGDVFWTALWAAPLTAEGLARTAADVVALTNAERAAAGLPPLTADARLTTAAQAHSADMIARAFYSHTSPDGREPWHRAAAAGSTHRSVGENIACGQRSPAEVVRGWMDSPGHRANILKPAFTHIGVGFAGGGPAGTYWTQLFGG